MSDTSTRLQSPEDAPTADRAAMLAALNAHGLATFGDVDETTSKRKGKRKQVHDDEEEEWAGIERGNGAFYDSDNGSVKDYGDEDEDWSGASDLDDGQDLLQISSAMIKSRCNAPPRQYHQSKTEVTVFQDPSRPTTQAAASLSATPLFASTNSARKAFMSSTIVLQGSDTVDQSKNKNQKGESDHVEEAHLRDLDQSLATLLNPTSTPNLQSLINHALPAQLPIQAQNHGRNLRRNLTQAKLHRTQRADAEAQQAGVVRAKHQGTGSSGRQALTRREKRKEDGTEKRERNRRRGIGGVVKDAAGGALKLSKREVRLGRAGKLGR